MFFGGERSAHQRLDTNYRKVTGAHACSDQLLGFAGAGECHRRLSKRRDIFEDSVLLLPVEEVGGRRAPATVTRHVLPKRDESIRFFIGERLEQNRVDDTEDRGVRTDTERERNHSNRAHPRMLQQHPHAIREIL